MRRGFAPFRAPQLRPAARNDAVWVFRLFYGQHLDPVVVGIADEIKPHVVILVTDATHGAVVFADGVVVARHAHAEMALVFAQFIGSGVVAQPCQFEAESRLPVAQINQYEASVARFLAVCFFQAQRLVVKFETASEVGDVDVEMVESAFDLHNYRI